jgi:hypothetical protein
MPGEQLNALANRPRVLQLRCASWRASPMAAEVRVWRMGQPPHHPAVPSARMVWGLSDIVAGGLFASPSFTAASPVRHTAGSGA